MKRTLMATLVALAIAGAASAQTAAPPPKAPDGQQPQPTTVTGKLEWADGMIALSSGGVLYYAPQVRELVGFVKDLQEGATVSLVGFARKIPYSPNSFFMASKLSFNGKDYEFARREARSEEPMGRGPGMMCPGQRTAGPGRDGDRDDDRDMR